MLTTSAVPAARSKRRRAGVDAVIRGDEKCKMKNEKCNSESRSQLRAPTLFLHFPFFILHFAFCISGSPREPLGVTVPMRTPRQLREEHLPRPSQLAHADFG